MLFSGCFFTTKEGKAIVHNNPIGNSVSSFFTENKQKAKGVRGQITRVKDGFELYFKRKEKKQKGEEQIEDTWITCLSDEKLAIAFRNALQLKHHELRDASDISDLFGKPQRIKDFAGFDDSKINMSEYTYEDYWQIHFERNNTLWHSRILKGRDLATAFCNILKKYHKLYTDDKIEELLNNPDAMTDFTDRYTDVENIDALIGCFFWMDKEYANGFCGSEINRAFFGRHNTCGQMYQSGERYILEFKYEKEALTPVNFGNIEECTGFRKFLLREMQIIKPNSAEEKSDRIRGIFSVQYVIGPTNS